MPHFYKGVGVGTFLHSQDLRLTGITPRLPTAPFNLAAVMGHVARGTTISPCISITRSFSIAKAYAIEGSKPQPTASMPAHVYTIDLPAHPNPLAPGIMSVEDPVQFVAANVMNLLVSPSYQHDGDKKFLLGVVDPKGHRQHLRRLAVFAVPGPIPKTPALSIELETMVFALRDAEAWLLGICLLVASSLERMSLDQSKDPFPCQKAALSIFNPKSSHQAT